MVKKKIKLKNKKIIYITLPILIIVIIAIIGNINKNKKAQRYYEQEKYRIQQYTKIEDFKSAEEVAIYLDSTLISKETSDIANIDYILKMKIKYNLSLNVKNYYEKLIQYMANILEYKNFYIIDEEKNITILVMCNNEKQTILNYYINNIESYFEKQQSNENINSYTQIDTININIISNELQQIIQNNWKVDNIHLGTIETTYRNYNIYFDEGYEIKKVNGKVFNIVFNEKYEKEIIQNIKTITNIDTIKNILGNPHFENNNLIGYKTENLYIFFSNNQISIYPIIEYSTDEIIQIIEKNKNTNNLVQYIDEIKNIWKDYDIYEYNSNYVVLQYTLKGIVIKYDATAQKGIVFYNNYNGKVSLEKNLQQIIQEKSELPEKMYFENIDLVFQEENNRILTLDDYTENRNYKYKTILNTSKNFKTNVDSNNNLKFISINKQYPNSELREKFYYGVWYDDNTFIYSVKNKGIYMYNAENRTYATIIEGNNSFELIEVINNILYYDNTSIDLNI